jgi:hypothetical protein
VFLSIGIAMMFHAESFTWLTERLKASLMDCPEEMHLSD